MEEKTTDNMALSEQIIGQAEYIWLDGATPTQRLRSKTRIVSFTTDQTVTIANFPQWSFDGSSTYQASGNDSDLLLEPVNFVADPIRGEGNFLVMCEVLNPDGTPHRTNHRARLREIMDAGAGIEEPWIGFEQEYTLTQDGTPLGFPEKGYPAPQGPYYCSVGSNVAFGRAVVEAHTKACLNAGLMIYGVNAEVLPGQWEFQIGYRGIKGESADPLSVSDHLWIARWLLYRIAEDFGVIPSFDAKPVKGDWNGSGKHTNFSTKSMRDPQTGMSAIESAIEALSGKHQEHIAVYGDGLPERLTGLHETASIHEFKSGVADRGSSIRIPQSVALKGYGYLEDRRPAANADPYQVSARILETICLSGGVNHTSEQKEIIFQSFEVVMPKTVFN
ncbi:MAG: glutamine synthetase beta-grasp domain-containing protein [Acidobacteriota bacterium]|nr:glutamine synthetase beta-grasp domain-containing protein [Acidobacteriota bacterium]